MYLILIERDSKGSLCKTPKKAPFWCKKYDEMALFFGKKRVVQRQDGHLYLLFPISMLLDWKTVGIDAI